MTYRPFGSLCLVLAALAALLATHAAAESLFLPRGKAQSRHATTGCETFGPDFHKVEGSETCVRIGGSVRLETTLATGGTASRH